MDFPCRISSRFMLVVCTSLYIVSYVAADRPLLLGHTNEQQGIDGLEPKIHNIAESRLLGQSAQPDSDATNVDDVAVVDRILSDPSKDTDDMSRLLRKRRYRGSINIVKESPDVIRALNFKIALRLARSITESLSIIANDLQSGSSIPQNALQSINDAQMDIADFTKAIETVQRSSNSSDDRPLTINSNSTNTTRVPKNVTGYCTNLDATREKLDQDKDKKLDELDQKRDDLKNTTDEKKDELLGEKYSNRPFELYSEFVTGKVNGYKEIMEKTRDTVTEAHEEAMDIAYEKVYMVLRNGRKNILNTIASLQAEEGSNNAESVMNEANVGLLSVVYGVFNAVELAACLIEYP